MKRKSWLTLMFACAAYKAGEQGAGAETIVVTDNATEDSALEVPITAEMGPTSFSLPG